MNRKKTFLGAAILIVVIVVAIVLVNRPKPTPTPAAAGPTASVSITKTGFVPATLQVKSGTTVVWSNDDSAPHQVASDPYPNHTALASLFDKTPLGAEQTYSYTFKTPGNWSYHDQLHPTLSGVVIVK